jgi:hypothetical protein
MGLGIWESLNNPGIQTPGLNLAPIYSTADREAVEELQDDGAVRLVHHFRHRLFWRYGV